MLENIADLWTVAYKVYKVYKKVEFILQKNYLVKEIFCHEDFMQFNDDNDSPAGKWYLLSLYVFNI